MIHDNYCDCLDCIKSNHFAKYFRRQGIDNAESVTKYIDGELKALVPVNVYTGTEGKLIRTVSPGNIVGKIYSYVETPSKEIWWMLYDNTFVKHAPNTFDLPHLEKSLKAVQQKQQSEIQKKVEIRQQANTSPMYKTGKEISAVAKEAGATVGGVLSTISFVGKNLRVFIIIVILALAAGYFYQIKKTL